VTATSRTGQRGDRLQHIRTVVSLSVVNGRPLCHYPAKSPPPAQILPCHPHPHPHPRFVVLAAASAALCPLLAKCFGISVFSFAMPVISRLIQANPAEKFKPQPAASAQVRPSQTFGNRAADPAIRSAACPAEPGSAGVPPAGSGNVPVPVSRTGGETPPAPAAGTAALLSRLVPGCQARMLRGILPPCPSRKSAPPPFLSVSICVHLWLNCLLAVMLGDLDLAVGETQGNNLRA